MAAVKKLIVIVAALVALWIGGRWFLHRGEVRATVILHDGGVLAAGDAVVENGAPVGRVVRVSRLDDLAAVKIRLDREHRRAVVSDSMFGVDGHRLVVNNTFAIGAPVDDGAVLQPPDGKVAQWLARHAGSLAQPVAKAKSAIDVKLDSVQRQRLDAKVRSLRERVRDWLDW